MAIHPESECCDGLEQRLKSFYSNPESYSAFENISNQTSCWSHVVEAIHSLAPKTKIRVLEVGSGKSGFARFLVTQGLREAVELHLHDITSVNRTFLEKESENVHIGPLPSGKSSFDIVFSTYVWEHVSTPHKTLTSWLELLRPGGHLLIFSPRYDFLGYLNPSMDHRQGWIRIATALRIAIWRLHVITSGDPAFLIENDPAIFHLPWKIDRDAVHWVSFWDLKAFLRNKGSLKILKMSHGRSWRDWLLKRYLTLAISFRLHT